MKTILLTGGYAPRYVPRDRLVFVRGGSLFAAPFDVEGLEVTGPAVRVLDNVGTDSVWATAQYAVSHNGTLVYFPRDDWARTRPTWVDRDGRLEPLDLPAQVYNTVRLSGDGEKLALQVAGAQDQIHVYDFRRSPLPSTGLFFLPTVRSEDGKDMRW